MAHKEIQASRAILVLRVTLVLIQSYQAHKAIQVVRVYKVIRVSKALKVVLDLTAPKVVLDHKVILAPKATPVYRVSQDLIQ